MNANGKATGHWGAGKNVGRYRAALMLAVLAALVLSSACMSERERSENLIADIRATLQTATSAAGRHVQEEKTYELNARAIQRLGALIGESRWDPHPKTWELIASVVIRCADGKIVSLALSPDTDYEIRVYAKGDTDVEEARLYMQGPRRWQDVLQEMMPKEKQDAS